MKEVLKNVIVAFASITKPEGFKDGKHMLAIYVDKATQKDITQKANKVWEDEKSKKVKKQDHGVDEWFSKDDDGKLMLWLAAKADNDRGITFKNAPGGSFTLDDFSKLGKGSVIDVSFGVYHYTYQGKEGLGRSINAVALHKLVEWDGNDGLDGDAISGGLPSGDVKEPKKKKKKKKKNKD